MRHVSSIQKPSPLRCYFAGSYQPFEHDFVDACFARSRQEARKLLWKHGPEIQAECDGKYHDMRVIRRPEHDHLAEKHGITEPGVVLVDKIQRDMGWSMDGDALCADCGLAEMDGDYPVCEHCEQCPECGHANDCPEREGVPHDPGRREHRRPDRAGVGVG